MLCPRRKLFIVPSHDHVRVYDQYMTSLGNLPQRDTEIKHSYLRFHEIILIEISEQTLLCIIRKFSKSKEWERETWIGKALVGVPPTCKTQLVGEASIKNLHFFVLTLSVKMTYSLYYMNSPKTTT